MDEELEADLRELRRTGSFGPVIECSKQWSGKRLHAWAKPEEYNDGRWGWSVT